MALESGGTLGMVTPFGLGLAAVGRPGYINLGHAADFADGRDVDAMRARCHTLLDAAWDAGVRHIDAARSYGRAEEFLGDWLRVHPGRREQLAVGSKWGYTYVADWRVDVARHEVKNHSLATLERQWKETLEALGGPPDVYLIHSVTSDSPALHDHALLDGLGRLAETGVRTGLSTSGAHQADVLGQALALGASGPLSAVQATWNVLETSCGAALAQVHAEGWHVALKETVANGRLTQRGDPPAALCGIAARLDVPPDAVAIAAAGAQPATVVLVGASTVDQLESNLAARSIQLTAGDLAALGGMAQPPADYWSERSRLEWN